MRGRGIVKQQSGVFHYNKFNSYEIISVFWQDKAGALQFEISRTALYDHRRFIEPNAPLFTHNRLPNGQFKFNFGAVKPSGEMRLDLWNAEVRDRGRGVVEIDLARGETVTLSSTEQLQDTTIVPVARGEGFQPWGGVKSVSQTRS